MERERQVGGPEWDLDEARSDHPSIATIYSWRLLAAVVALGAFLIVLLVAGQEDAAERTRAVPIDAGPATGETSTTALSGLRSDTRVIAQFEGPVLGIRVGATLVSTDFDGRVVTLDLDSGLVTRTLIRTGNFLTVEGRLIVQTGCGGWQSVDLTEHRLGESFIGCGSFQPVAQRGAEAQLFRPAGRETPTDVLIADGAGGLLAASLLEDPSSSYATVSAGRVLIVAEPDELLWIDAVTGESTPYASGRLLAASPGGVLWSECADATDCGVWYGSPTEARVNRFPVDFGNEPNRALLNGLGTRAVFFLPEDVLRIVTIETGHAREVENPGIDLATATWSPDGLWLFDPTGAEVIALNTLNGRTVTFTGVPGDVSPGWVGVVDSP